MDAANFQHEHALGTIYGWFSPRGLRQLLLPKKGAAQKYSVLHSSANDHRVWALNTALERYFAGVRETFDAIPIDFEGATVFRRAVWEGARRVPWGETTSYGGLAKLIGRPKAARAVGQALGANPVPIIVPCHRFIAGDGSIGGFGAGLDWKRELLRVEGLCL